MIDPASILKVLERRGYIDQSACLTPCYGGDIHQSFSISNGDTEQPKYFIKVNKSENAAVLKTEYQALIAFDRLTPSKYPSPVMFDSQPKFACLLMAHHQISPLNESTAAALGTALAQQHAVTSSSFGWQSDNYIGLSKQHNKWTKHWPSFFWQQRLAPQLGWATQCGLPSKEQQTIAGLENQIDSYFNNYKPTPALLHGDLWSGNAGFDSKRQQALLYDPAPYYGDPEADLAMTELFGSFPREFYLAYHRNRPEDPGYAKRRPLYNLYHALNHWVLFGSSYLGLVQDQLAQLRVIKQGV